MQIAIVDDLAVERKLAKQLIGQYFYQHRNLSSPALNLQEFASGEEFWQNFTPNTFSLIFLDIYMGGLNGILLAKKIRNLDKNCQIIFFTSSQEHLLDGYDVQACGYLLKPLNLNLGRLYKTLDYCWEKLALDKRSLAVTSEKTPLMVAFRELIYLEYNNSRSINLHLTTQVLPVSDSYAYFANNLLTDRRFIECYHKLILNLDYVANLQETDFLLKTGSRIPISRRKKLSVKQAYIEYFLTK